MPSSGRIPSCWTSPNRRKRKRRSSRKTARTKKTYSIDGKTYDSKPLLDYHKELAGLVEEGTIDSFELPEAGEASRSKYHAYKAVIDGIQFDSLNESRYYVCIKQVRDNHQETEHGKLLSFEMQVPYTIVPSHIKKGHRIRKMEYLADFVLHYEDGTERVIDVKGVETDVFKLKKKFIEYVYPDVVIECLKYVPALHSFLTTKAYKKYVKGQKAKKAA